MKIIVWSWRERFRYSIVYTNSILFILGLIFSYKLVQYAMFQILITRLTNEWKNYDLGKAAIVVNLQEGTYAVLLIMFVFLADAYSGLFKMLVCSTTVYIIGLLLAYFASWKGSLDPRVFYPALVLMTLSHAAKKVTLKAFLDDQLVPRDRRATEEEEERADTTSGFIWNCASILAAIVALVGPSKIASLKNLSIVLASVMVAAFLLFLLGFKLYSCVEPTGSPLSDVGFVIRRAIIKRNLEYPPTPDQLFENSSGLVQISPHVLWLRWLDRAAVMEQEQDKNVCTVEQVKGVKFLLKMFSIWTTFFTFSMVAASGSTFFLEEAYNINDNFPALIFILLQSFTTYMVSRISDYLLKKLYRHNNNIEQRTMLVRIGVGMICCVLCCIAAWTNAVHRLSLARLYGDPKDKMSVFRLIPQFLLLALMDGFSRDGFERFFESQVSEPVSKYPIGECAVGFGKYMGVVSILIFKRWFTDDVNTSELDKYYVFLTVLSSANVLVYCLIAYWYGDDKFVSEDREMRSIDVEVDRSRMNLLLGVTKSFPPVSSSRGIQRRLHSMPYFNKQ